VSSRGRSAIEEEIVRNCNSGFLCGTAHVKDFPAEASSPQPRDALSSPCRRTGASLSRGCSSALPASHAQAASRRSRLEPASRCMPDAREQLRPGSRQGTWRSARRAQQPAKPNRDRVAAFGSHRPNCNGCNRSARSPRMPVDTTLSPRCACLSPSLRRRYGHPNATIG